MLNRSNKFLLFDMLVYSFFHVIGPTGYGLVWKFPKKLPAAHDTCFPGGLLCVLVNKLLEILFSAW